MFATNKPSSDGVRFTSTTYYPTDQEGKPIWVINDGLIITLVQPYCPTFDAERFSGQRLYLSWPFHGANPETLAPTKHSFSRD